MSVDFKYNSISNQLPSYIVEDEQGFLKTFIQKYYEFLESVEIHYTDLVLDEAEVSLQSGESASIDLQTGGDLLLESPRTTSSTFIVGEILIGQTSGATGIIKGVQQSGEYAGGYTSTDPHHLFVVETSDNKFEANEKIVGSTSRASATVSTLKINPVAATKDFFDSNDINSLNDLYKVDFQQEFIPNIPLSAKNDFATIVKQIQNVYRSKGTESALKWLWKVLYQSDNIELYYPRTNILKVSGGNWTKEKSLKIDLGSVTNVSLFPNKKITGSQSNATAIVESYKVVTFEGLQVGELIISEIEGEFQTGELIATELNVEGEKATAILLTVLQDVVIVDGGTNYNVGDFVTVTAGTGAGANVQITAVSDGVLEGYEISDGGDGYFVGDQFSIVGGSPTLDASATVGTITESGNYFFTDISISSFSSVAINASDYGGGLSGKNANSHLYSNTLTTFIATVNTVSNFAVGHTLIDNNHSGAMGTAAAVLTGTTQLVYAIKDPTSPTFVAGDNPSVIIAQYANGEQVSGAVASVQNNYVVNSLTTSTSYYGALYSSTGNWKAYGTINSASVVSSGTGYKEKPVVTISNPTTSLLHPSQVSIRSRILNLQENVFGLFIPDDIITGGTSFAKGKVLDPHFGLTANTTFSSLRYLPLDVKLALDSTDGSADAGDDILLEDGYPQGHSTYTSTTSLNGSLQSEITFFANSEIVSINRSSLITANTYHGLNPSAADVVDTSTLGENANVEIANLTIGSISSIQIVNPGLGYTVAPTLEATSGDNNAILTATVGPLNNYPPRYADTSSLLNSTDKIQDSKYYQDFSYVIKTDIPVTQFRDAVKSINHPAGFALFGEIAIRTFMSARSTLPTAAQEYTKIFYGNAYSTQISSTNRQVEIELSANGTVSVNAQATTSTFPEIQFKEYVDNINVLLLGPSSATDTLSWGSEIQISPTIADSTISTTTDFHNELHIFTNNQIESTIVDFNIEKNLIPSNTQIFSNQIEVQLEQSLEANIEIVVSDITPLPEIETTLPKVNVTQIVEQNVFQPKRVSGSAFAESGNNVIRMYPTIAEFYKVHETTSSDEKAAWYAGVSISDVHIVPDQQQITDLLDEDVFLPDINIELEEEFGLLLEDGTLKIGLEDGYAPGHGSYTTSSDQGTLHDEVDLLMNEYGHPLSLYDGYEKLYRVNNINTGNNTSFEVFSSDENYVNESILSLNKMYTKPFIPA